MNIFTDISNSIKKKTFSLFPSLKLDGYLITKCLCILNGDNELARLCSDLFSSIYNHNTGISGFGNK